jgi:hypothetical protein
MFMRDLERAYMHMWRTWCKGGEEEPMGIVAHHDRTAAQDAQASSDSLRSEPAQCDQSDEASRLGEECTDASTPNSDATRGEEEGNESHHDCEQAEGKAHAKCDDCSKGDRCIEQGAEVAERCEE